MADKTQKKVDEAVIDHLAANDPDAQIRENYWRNQYNELVKQNTHYRKESKRMDWMSMALCYSIYIACSINAAEHLVTYDGSEWDAVQRLLWVVVLALNVAFGVFVAMSRVVTKCEKKRIEDGWNATKQILELKGKLDVAEHNAECLKNDLEWEKNVSAVYAETNAALIAENEKLKKKK